MQTVRELRDELVNYSDMTPNEPAFTQDNVLSTDIFYPLGNIYPFNHVNTKLPMLCTNEENTFVKEYFCNQLYSQQIKYAIRYLQIGALKKFISKNKTNVLLPNPFSYLFETVYPVDKNIDITKQIIQILIDNYDDHYNMIMILTQWNHKPEQKYILELLYTFLPNDDDNMCGLCLCTEPKQMLINACVCKTLTHADCLVKFGANICLVCKQNYKLNKPIYVTPDHIDKTMYFPHNDIYYHPLIGSKNFIKFVGMSRLSLAILYLQVDRVNELLNEKEIIDNLPNYYLGHVKYKQNPLMVLAQGNMETNANVRFGDNRQKYIAIMKMLLDTKKIDLSAIDTFGKTFQDYINCNDFFINIF